MIKNLGITTDLIVCLGLIIALVLSIVLGGGESLQTAIVGGLTGWLSNSLVNDDNVKDKKKEATDGTSEHKAS